MTPRALILRGVDTRGCGGMAGGACTPGRGPARPPATSSRSAPTGTRSRDAARLSQKSALLLEARHGTQGGLEQALLR
jgi:hypothetical protein